MVGSSPRCGSGSFGSAPYCAGSGCFPKALRAIDSANRASNFAVFISSPSRSHRGEAEARRRYRKHRHDRGNDKSLWHACPCVLGVNQLVYEAEDPGREQHKKVDDAACPMLISTE